MPSLDGSGVAPAGVLACAVGAARSAGGLGIWLGFGLLSLSIDGAVPSEACAAAPCKGGEAGARLGERKLRSPTGLASAATWAPWAFDAGAGSWICLIVPLRLDKFPCPELARAGASVIVAAACGATGDAALGVLAAFEAASGTAAGAAVGKLPDWAAKAASANDSEGTGGGGGRDWGGFCSWGPFHPRDGHLYSSHVCNPWRRLAMSWGLTACRVTSHTSQK